jgi:hypothetical protein
MAYPFKTEQEAKDFIRKVMGLPRRVLEGKERDQIWLLLSMLEPVRQSNNQRTWTDEYMLNDKKYEVTYGLEDRSEIAELEIDFE